MNVTEIVAAIAALDGDRALTGALAGRLRDKAPNFVSEFAQRRRMTTRNFPHPHSIMAAQCSVFDNWVEFGGKRPKRGSRGHYRDRFKLEIQVWTWTQADIDWQNCAWRGTAHLWDTKDLQARVSKKGMKLPKALPDDFRDTVIDMIDVMDGFRIGLPYTKDGKALLYNSDRTFMVAREDQLLRHAVETIIVRTPGGDFAFEDFRSTTSRGGALQGNCFAHSRMTTEPALAAKWNATLFSHQPASADSTGAAEG